jgi:hypothetical protein
MLSNKLRSTFSQACELKIHVSVGRFMKQLDPWSERGGQESNEPGGGGARVTSQRRFSARLNLIPFTDAPNITLTGLSSRF